MQKYLYVAIGGSLGAIARFWMGPAIASQLGVRFPYGTLAINMTACIVIGFSLTFLSERANFNPAWRYIVPVGFVGAYSTFSTYEWETLAEIRTGTFSLAALYAFSSLFLGLVAVWCGIWLAELIS